MKIVGCEDTMTPAVVLESGMREKFAVLKVEETQSARQEEIDPLNVALVLLIAALQNGL
jgi:hypothetical protein